MSKIIQIKKSENKQEKRNNVRRIMNKRNAIKSLIVTGIIFLNANVHAEPGVNEGELKNLISAYTDPIKNVMIWIVPTVAIIGALVLGIKHFFKNEQEQEEFDLVGKLIKLGIVASLLQSVAIVFKIFGL